MYAVGDRIYVNSSEDGQYTGEVIHASKPRFTGQVVYVRLDKPQWMRFSETGHRYLLNTRIITADLGENPRFIVDTRVRLLSRKGDVQ